MFHILHLPVRNLFNSNYQGKKGVLRDIISVLILWGHF